MLKYRHDHFTAASLICLLLFNTVIEIYLNLNVWLHCKLGLYFSIFRTSFVCCFARFFFVSVSSEKYSASVHICFIINKLELEETEE